MPIKIKRVVPTVAEDAVINAGIACAPDTYELDVAEFKQLKRCGRPPAAAPKVAVSVRYEQDVIGAFRRA